MNDERTVLEGAIRQLRPEQGILDRVYERRRRKQRNERIAAATVALAVVALVVASAIAVGQAVSAPSPVPAGPPPMHKSFSILDGEVTFSAPSPWDVGFAGPWGLWLDQHFGERVHVLADSVSIAAGCQPAPASADAEALVQSIRSDPDLKATQPVAVTVGGTEALRIDVVAARGASVCPDWDGPGVIRQKGPYHPDSTVVVEQGHRMRLYVLDLPGGSAHTLAIAIVAPKARLQKVIQAAEPIVASFEFKPA